MGKIISIYGSNGSGKSIIATNLAYMLANDKATGLVTTSIRLSGVSKLLNMKIEDDKSLKKIYLNVNDTDYISKFAQYQGNKNLFVLTTPDSIDCLTLADPACYLSGTDAQNLILEVKNKFDYVVFDCDNSVNNPISTYALKYSDFVLNIIKPTVQGIEFEKSYGAFFEKLKITNKLIRIINNDKNYLPIRSVEEIIGAADYVLPHEKGIEISENEGILYMSRGGGGRTFLSGIKDPWRKKFGEIVRRVM